MRSLSAYNLREHMNLRDYFAASALQGMLANPVQAGEDDEALVDLAWQYANMMMSARDAEFGIGPNG